MEPARSRVPTCSLRRPFLTVATRDLLRKIRDIAKVKEYKFVWTKDSHIFVRENESSPASGCRRRVDREYHITMAQCYNMCNLTPRRFPLAQSADAIMHRTPIS
ncbi:hypothetical protein ANN_06374 [Periplaneta americana]|uniref:FP protein C-terminal domain-containing protein n=1 Tax=Periplaneta americana TaxID=6978 RepID=A0ABQ8TDJ4_PERAM|nr:hypothetical protein ANN_06374 [Periplaneta americana]